MEDFGRVVYLILYIVTGMLGYTIHGSLFWAVVDMIFTPITLVYWLITHQINATVITETFGFLLK